MESIRGLIPFVRKAGELAVERQNTVLRSFKADGSVLTQVDRDIDKFLTNSIVSLYPEAAVVSEENTGEEDEGGEEAGADGSPAGPEVFSSDYIFAVDPIDGTDCFSQGMPGWSLSVGLLDRTFQPIAGMVYAPRWGPEPGGAFLFADIGARTLLNDEELPAVNEEPIGSPQVFAGSSIHKRYRMETFRGKVRNAGSTAIHIVAPLMHRAVVGTIFSPNYIWDIVGAHAVVNGGGLFMEYYDGRQIDYRRLVRREKAEGTIVSGTRNGIAIIRKTFRPLS